MNLKSMKKLIILFVLSTLCFSCTKEKRREIIKEEVTKSDSAIVATNNYSDGDSKYRYVINKRTGKVHSYSHGSSIVSDRYRLETNDDMVTYRCDLFKDAGYGKGDNIYSKSGMQTLKNAEGEEIDKEWKNYCVVDDSSKFAAAVYYHYINKEILKDKESDDRVGYGIDLWGTNSTNYLNRNSFTNKLLETRRFKLYTWDNIMNDDTNIYNLLDNSFELLVGDLVCRSGNVEFYLGNGKIVGWGRVHKTNILNKEFHIERDGFYSDNRDDDKLPYTTILRFKGGKNGKE